MNSRTSRPRSPTRQMTLTSADVERAIIPSSEDLPTPEPAKMPRRWPRPQGTSESSARTPSVTRSVIRGRSSGDGGAPTIGRWASAVERRAAVDRVAEAVEHAARAARGRSGTETSRPVAVTMSPGPMPCISPSGISSVRPERKPTTSAGIVVQAGRRRSRPVRTVADLADLGLQAGRLDDQPDQVHDAAVAAVQVGARDGAAAASRQRARATRAQPSAMRSSSSMHLARTRELGGQRRVDLALDRADDRAAARDAALGLHVAVLDAAELGDQRSDAARTSSRSSGLTRTVTRSRSTSRRSAPRTTSTTALGLGRRRAAAAPARRSAAPARRPRPRRPRRQRSRSAATAGGRGLQRGDRRGHLLPGPPAAGLRSPPRGRPRARRRPRRPGRSAGSGTAGARGVSPAAAPAAGSSKPRPSDDVVLGGSPSSPPRPSVIAPASSRRRMAPTMRPWASSTTARRCGCAVSRSSWSISAPRVDMLRKMAP